MLYFFQFRGQRTRHFRVSLVDRSRLIDSARAKLRRHDNTAFMDAPVNPSSKGELIERVAIRLRDLGLSAPAILFLQVHAPLSFLGSQFILASQPFLGWLTGDRLLRDLAVFLEDPENVESLITRLEQ